MMRSGEKRKMMMKKGNQKSKIYKIQTEEPKPKKKKNEKNRKRNVFMNFRVFRYLMCYELSDLMKAMRKVQ